MIKIKSKFYFFLLTIFFSGCMVYPKVPPPGILEPSCKELFLKANRGYDYQQFGLFALFLSPILTPVGAGAALMNQNKLDSGLKTGIIDSTAFALIGINLFLWGRTESEKNNYQWEEVSCYNNDQKIKEGN